MEGETGRIWLPQILLRPDLELAAFSIDDNNTFASIATYYCQRKWRLLESEVLVAGRLSLHLLENKLQATKLLTFNVYGPAGADQESKRLLDKILNTILEKIRLVKQRHPLISCYIVSDFNVNLNDESLPKSRALRSFAAAGQLTEMTADLPATWKGVRGNKVSHSKLDHIFTDNVARLEAGSFPNPDSDHHVVYVKPFPKEKIRDPDPPPFEFHSTKILKGKTNSQMFAKQVASEVYQEYMLPDENVLLGRLQENSDVSHPSFIPNMEDFFLNRVDKNPIEKFNILSSILSKKIEKKVKDENKTYMKSQARYI